VRVTTVQSARKPQTCGRCRTEIPKGSGYRWAKPRYGRKMVRCLSTGCNFRPTDLSSSKMARIEEAIEDARESIDLAEDYEGIKSALESCAEIAREVADEYQEANDAWAGGNGREDLQEKIDSCEAFADELEGWEYGDLTDEEEIRQQVRDEEDGPEQGETEEEFTERLEQLEDDRWEQELQAMRDEAGDLLSNFEGA
jgi:hypothetical protein